MASSISICSNALLALGAHPINSFDEATEHARLCSNIYPTVRNDLLRKHPWNCAVKRVVLSPSSTAPAFGFGYQFPLPGDLIRILSVGREYEDIGYRVEGNRLLANQNVIYLRYLFRNEDESTWDSSLVNLVPKRSWYRKTGVCRHRLRESARQSDAGSCISSSPG
ncbi:hypothetical protein QYS46_21915 [Klebsiella michiganensis]|nr:hypothetical protein [Klebsiella michiganensis]